MSIISRVVSRLTKPVTGRQYAPMGITRMPKIPGVRLSMETAFAVSAVFACVTVIAKSLAGNRAHWEVVEMKANGDWIYRRNTNAWWLLNYQPNYEMTPKVFKEVMFITALLWGDGIAEIERDILGRPLWLWPLDPYKTHIERTESGQKVVKWDSDVIIPWNDVLAFQGPTNGLCGYNTVALAAVTIAQLLASDQFNLKFYEHGTAMGGIVSSEQELDEDEIADLRDQLEKRVAGAEQAFRLLILGQGLKFQSVNQTQKDGMVLDTRYFLIEEICRYYGMQPHKIAHLLRSTNNNIEHQGLEFTCDTLTPWVTGAEEECTIKLFPTRSMFAFKIDTDELAEGDAVSRAQTDSTLVNSGLRTRNELRQKRGWNSYGPDGDKVTVQLAMTTLDKIGQVENAAQQIFNNAVVRSMRRQLHRAQSLVRPEMTMTTFRDAVLERVNDETSYMHTVINEALHVLNKLGLRFDLVAASQVIKETVRENAETIADTYPNVYIDASARAQTMTSKLLALVQKEIEYEKR